MKAKAAYFNADGLQAESFRRAVRMSASIRGWETCGQWPASIATGSKNRDVTLRGPVSSTFRQQQIVAVEVDR